MSDKMRDDFEAWAIADAESTDKALKFERGDDWYLGKDHQVMNLGWAAWQASREALVIEWPDRHTYTIPDCAGAAILDCRTAFSKAVKVKP